MKKSSPKIGYSFDRKNNIYFSVGTCGQYLVWVIHGLRWVVVAGGGSGWCLMGHGAVMCHGIQVVVVQQ